MFTCMSTILVAVPRTFVISPLPGCKAPSLPMHWSLTWGTHFLYTGSIHNVGGKHLGIWRESGGKPGATVPGQREAPGNLAGIWREVRSKWARPILFLQQGRARRTKSGHAEKHNTAGVSLLTSCGTNPCPGGWYSSIFQVSLALLPLERSGACYCLWQFPTRLVPLEKHGGRQDEKYMCFKEKRGENPLLPLKHAEQVVPRAR